MRIGGIATLLLAACGSSAPSTYADYVAAGQKLFCQHAVDCGFAESSYAALCEQTAAQNTSGIDFSMISYDQGAASRCLDAFKRILSDCHAQLDLGNVTSALKDCRAVATGKQQAGGSCPHGIECAPGLVCNLNIGNATCSAKCEPPVTTGGSCSFTCADGDYCDLATGKCAPQLDAGAACASNGDCKPGLYCVGSGSNTCASPGGAGAPCASFERASCNAGLYCDSTSHACAAEKQMGQACLSGDECAARLLCIQTSATTMASCQSPLAEGASCFGSGCLVPLQCLNGVCTRPPELGQPCTTSCLNGYCNATSKKCEALIAVGAACDPTYHMGIQCQGGASCDPTTKTCQLCQ